MNQLMQFLLLAMKGCLIGIANIIPGVSGGTIAVAMNIYAPLVESIGHFPHNLKNPPQLRHDIAFLTPVIAGALTGIVIFSKIISHLLVTQRVNSQLFFVGLIIGSLPLLFKLGNFKKPHWASILAFVLAAAMMLSFFILENHTSKDFSLQAFGNDDLRNPMYLLWLGLCGFIAAVAMVVPGLSGSLLLVMLGAYGHILTMISRLTGSSEAQLSWNLCVLGLCVFAAGIGLGIICCARLIDYLMKKYPQSTMAFILGLMIFSILPIWPAGMIFSVSSLLIYTGVILAGAAAAYTLGR